MDSSDSALQLCRKHQKLFLDQKKSYRANRQKKGYFLAFENNFFASIFLQEGASCSLSSAFSISLLELQDAISRKFEQRWDYAKKCRQKLEAKN